MKTPIAVFFSAVLLTACGGYVEDDDSPPEPWRPPSDSIPRPFRTLKIWVAEDPLLPKVLIKQGCETWLVEGIQCELQNRVEDAEVRISAGKSDCKGDANGKVVIGTAFGDGRILLYVDCIGVKGRNDLPAAHLNHTDPVFESYRQLVAHEVGHQLGIWAHVPYECDGMEQYHDIGTPICGRATMNPLIGGFAHLTVWDHLAYEALASDKRDVDPSGRGLMLLKDNECKFYRQP
jgi:hypothetical protein